MAYVSPRNIEGIIEDLTIVQRSPKAYDLLKWASKKLDLTKVSSQTDLTQWLRETIKEQAQELGVTEKEFAKRFRGMVKFFTNTQYGLEAVREIQEGIAEKMVEDAQDAIVSAKDIDDIIRAYQRYRVARVPPLAPAVYQQQLDSAVADMRKHIAAVTRAPQYKEILEVLKRAKSIIEKEKYKELPRATLRSMLVELSTALVELSIARAKATRLQKKLGIPYTIHTRTIDRYRNILRRELIRRAALRRRPLRRVRPRVIRRW